MDQQHISSGGARGSGGFTFLVALSGFEWRRLLSFSCRLQDGDGNISLPLSLLPPPPYLRQLLHEVVEAAVLLAEECILGQEHVFKEELTRVLRRRRRRGDKEREREEH